jgi:hypothetical protein
MSSRNRQRALLAVAVAAVVAAILIATLSSTGHRGRSRSATAAGARAVIPGDLSVASAYLGLTARKLRADLRSGKTLAAIAGRGSGHSANGLLEALVAAKRRQLEAAVRAGTLSRSQQTARLAALRRRADAEVHRAHRAAVGGVRYLAVTTRYLGITAKQLRERRRSGESLAEIADATAGKSATGLIDALVSDRRGSLARDAAAGELDRSEEVKLLSRLRVRVTRQVDRKPHRRG